MRRSDHLLHLSQGRGVNLRYGRMRTVSNLGVDLDRRTDICSDISKIKPNLYSCKGIGSISVHFSDIGEHERIKFYCHSSSSLFRATPPQLPPEILGAFLTRYYNKMNASNSSGMERCRGPADRLVAPFVERAVL